MLSSGFIDLVLAIVFISFSMKGYITGFIRSVVTLVAVIIAFGLSAAMPTLLAPALKYSISPASAQFLVLNRIAAFIVIFLVAQGIGFLATGLLEKIGLGTADKAVGALLGIVTAIMVGCLPGIAIYQSPAAFHNPANQKYFKSSFFMRTYHPLVKSVARPPKAKPVRRSAAAGRVVT